eukprot:351671-Amphidinium_carterae.1
MAHRVEAFGFLEHGGLDKSMPFLKFVFFRGLGSNMIHHKKACAELGLIVQGKQITTKLCELLKPSLSMTSFLLLTRCGRSSVWEGEHHYFASCLVEETVGVTSKLKQSPTIIGHVGDACAEINATIEELCLASNAAIIERINILIVGRLLAVVWLPSLVVVSFHAECF